MVVSLNALAMQDAAAWLFPSTEGSRAAALLQPQPKSKQLTQQFNKFFRRKKPKQAPSEEGISQPDSDILVGQEEDRVKGQQLELRQLQDPELEPMGLQGTSAAKSSSGPGLNQLALQQLRQAQGNPVVHAGQAPTSPDQQPDQAASAQPQLLYTPVSSERSLLQTAPMPSPAPLPSQAVSAWAIASGPRNPSSHQHASTSPSSVQATAQVPYQGAAPFQGMAELPYLSPPSAIESSMALPPGRQTLPVSPQDLGQGPGAVPCSPLPVGGPNPDRAEQRQGTRPSRAQASPKSQPVITSDAVPVPVLRRTLPSQTPQPTVPILMSGQRPRLRGPGLLTDRLAQPDEDYQPGMYDGSATVSSQPLAELQQQVAWQQVAWQQLPWQQQHQHQLPYTANGDHIMDMGDQADVNKPALFEPQHAQRTQHSVGRIERIPNQAAAYSELAQQVPFYDSSPQYMPSTLTARPPIQTRALSRVTNFLGFHKQQQSCPRDVEAGADHMPNSPNSGQIPLDPPPLSGCSPRSALLRSGIFQNSKPPDQDKPMTPEQAERRARGLVRTRVEPKVFFANERTFLQWLQISVLLMFTGLSLLGGSSVGGSKGGSGGSSSSTCASNDTACKASKVSAIV